ncbi:MAG: rod shape-determining protein [Planctomycetota bacterium]
MRILDRFLNLFSKDIAIDLGTANTLVAVRGQGVVLSEPSVVAVRKGTSTVIAGGTAVGYAAKEMIGKTPGNIQAVRPMKDGVIADFEITQAMLTYFIRKVHQNRFVRPRVAIAIPTGITAVEKRAVRESAMRAGAREVFLIEEPLAAALGAGLPIMEPVGSMIADIGGGTTEVAVISLADMVVARSVRVAGDEMDDAIIDFIKRTYSMLIGETTAEKIKVKIGSAVPLEPELSMEVRGRDLVAGLPRSITVTSQEIREALSEPLRAILETIKSALENTPPEIAGDLYDRGIVLAGGGALLNGIDKLIMRETGLKVKVAEDPLTCVARGCALYLENLDQISKEKADSEA